MDTLQLSSTEVVYRSILRRYPMEPWTLKLVKAIIMGCMSASSVASPILFELRKIWFADMGIFFLSWTAFMLQHGEPLKIYGPFTLVFGMFLGFAAYSSSSTPLPELIPWIPIPVWAFTVVTVYLLPKIYRSLNVSDHEQSAIEMEEGRSPPRGFGMRQMPAPDAGEQLNSEVREWQDQMLVHMDRRSETPSSGRGSAPETDITLPEPTEPARLFQTMVNLFLLDQLPQSTANLAFAHGYLNGGPSRVFDQARDRTSRPDSSDNSLVVNDTASISQDSERPLLG